MSKRRSNDDVTDEKLAKMQKLSPEISSTLIREILLFFLENSNQYDSEKQKMEFVKKQAKDMTALEVQYGLTREEIKIVEECVTKIVQTPTKLKAGNLVGGAILLAISYLGFDENYKFTLSFNLMARCVNHVAKKDIVDVSSLKQALQELFQMGEDGKFRPCGESRNVVAQPSQQELFDIDDVSRDDSGWRDQIFKDANVSV
jgi:hypothetical protein